ncbi:hypothetical protein MRX96_037260 [Rhipicephalus microplus]
MFSTLRPTMPLRVVRLPQLLIAAALLSTGFSETVTQPTHEDIREGINSPMPYGFKYGAYGDDGGGHTREESADGSGRVVGSYTIFSPEGFLRRVFYEADENGFRARVETNEPGTKTSNPADVTIVSTADGGGPAGGGGVGGGTRDTPLPGGSTTRPVKTTSPDAEGTTNEVTETTTGLPPGYVLPERYRPNASRRPSGAELLTSRILTVDRPVDGDQFRLLVFLDVPGVTPGPRPRTQINYGPSKDSFGQFDDSFAQGGGPSRPSFDGPFRVPGGSSGGIFSPSQVSPKGGFSGSQGFGPSAARGGGGPGSRSPFANAGSPKGAGPGSFGTRRPGVNYPGAFSGGAGIGQSGPSGPGYQSGAGQQYQPPRARGSTFHPRDARFPKVPWKSRLQRSAGFQRTGSNRRTRCAWRLCRTFWTHQGHLLAAERLSVVPVLDLVAAFLEFLQTSLIPRDLVINDSAAQDSYRFRAVKRVTKDSHLDQEAPLEQTSMGGSGADSSNEDGFAPNDPRRPFLFRNEDERPATPTGPATRGGAGQGDGSYAIQADNGKIQSVDFRPGSRPFQRTGPGNRFAANRGPFRRPALGATHREDPFRPYKPPPLESGHQDPIFVPQSFSGPGSSTTSFDDAEPQRIDGFKYQQQAPGFGGSRSPDGFTGNYPYRNTYSSGGSQPPTGARDQFPGRPQQPFSPFANGRPVPGVPTANFPNPRNHFANRFLDRTPAGTLGTPVGSPAGFSPPSLVSMEVIRYGPQGPKVQSFNGSALPGSLAPPRNLQQVGGPLKPTRFPGNPFLANRLLPRPPVPVKGNANRVLYSEAPQQATLPRRHGEPKGDKGDYGGAFEGLIRDERPDLLQLKPKQKPSSSAQSQPGGNFDFLEDLLPFYEKDLDIGKKPNEAANGDVPGGLGNSFNGRGPFSFSQSQGVTRAGQPTVASFQPGAQAQGNDGAVLPRFGFVDSRQFRPRPSAGGVSGREDVGGDVDTLQKFVHDNSPPPASFSFSDAKKSPLVPRRPSLSDGRRKTLNSPSGDAGKGGQGQVTREAPEGAPRQDPASLSRRPFPDGNTRITEDLDSRTPNAVRGPFNFVDTRVPLDVARQRVVQRRPQAFDSPRQPGSLPARADAPALQGIPEDSILDDGRQGGFDGAPEDVTRQLLPTNRRVGGINGELIGPAVIIPQTGPVRQPVQTPRPILLKVERVPLGGTAIPEDLVSDKNPQDIQV